MWHSPKNREVIKQERILTQLLAQTRGFPRSSELPSPKRELEERNKELSLRQELSKMALA
ncbi:hypothetical protein DEO72_LG9g1024 [Vigna unguiculata]|uniref:Uncharacterized protein n=1 Tax=Vigna unguiculata TaxID=3917 RepID=A0A4D6N1R1_VIGUN|nr:hypothetical protein DEO72_LG9g1024 [Vigna unguiculata]